MFDIVSYSDEVWRGARGMDEYRSGTLRERGLSEVAEDVMFWPSVSNVGVFRGPSGLVMLDTGEKPSARQLFELVRGWTDLPVRHAIFSHGHVDHVFGVDPFDEEARENGVATPTVWAHEAITARFARYAATTGYCEAITRRQFQQPEVSWPTKFRQPDVLYHDRTVFTHDGQRIELFHARGETDDHTYIWMPQKRLLCTGDLFIWAAPNAGNPQKVQRYAADWALALRHMSSLGADTLLPGHGLPIVGQARVKEALDNTALYLESLVSQVLAMMNAGASLNQIIHEVAPPQHLAELPYLQACYDEPEFLVNNIWRLNGGWYRGNPSELKPARETELAAEFVALSGGSSRVVDRAGVLAEEGSFRLACHLIETAALASPGDLAIQEARAEIYAARAALETSTMARGIFNSAAADSRAAVSGTDFASEIVKTPEGRLAAMGIQVVGALSADLAQSAALAPTS